MTVSTNADGFSQQLKKYAAIFGKGGKMGEVIINRAKHLAIELYGKTRAVAPTQSEIAGDVQRQGWKIPKTFPDGREGRGEPSQWIGTALSSLPRRRGRKSAARTAQEAAILSGKPTLQQMQAFVIKTRSRHIGYVATGWLDAIHDLGGGARPTGRGGAEIHGEGADTEIDIKNDTPGIIEVDQKHQVIRQAIDAQVEYMGKSIAEELHQEMAAA